MEVQAVQEQVIGAAAAAPQVGPRSGTVSGSHRGTEIEVVGQQQWEEIRQRRAGGQSVSAIARELGLDRKTVRGCLKREQWAPYQRTAVRPSLLDAHRQWLSERAPQVAYSARILYQELTKQRGFTGCYEVVKVAVRPLRAAATVASVTQMRFETAPGEQAQVDWGQISVTLGGVRTKVHVFVMTLGYSRRGYAEGYLNERMENLLSAHERAFEHFGGSCHTVLYDRMRTVVAGLVEDGSRARLNERFAAFADHWGFAVRLCRPYRAKTKGKVESGVKYVKGNFIPGRSFTDLEVLRQVLMTRPVLHADETPVAMLAPGKGKTHKAYIWSYGTTEFDPIKAVLYDFAEGRSGKHARRVLKGWTGTLVCDDYAGYKALFQNTVTEAGCMAHARRKFHDLWANHQSTLAKEALDLFGALYDVERIARELDADQRHRLRQLRSKPITDTMHEWLTLHRRRATDGTAIAKAIDYSLGRWVALTRFLDDGALPIDNNWIENRIRPIALGRSNWLFAGSLRGGQRAAAAMSLIQSAKLNGLDPYRYLRDVLERLPTHPNSRIEELLPHRWTSATAEH